MLFIPQINLLVIIIPPPADTPTPAAAAAVGASEIESIGEPSVDTDGGTASDMVIVVLAWRLSVRME